MGNYPVYNATQREINPLIMKLNFINWRDIMFSKKIILSLVSGLFVLATANSYAAETLTSGDVVAREASEGPRGADNERPGDRQHRGGRAIIDSAEFILAREASEGQRGADNERPGDRQHRGGRAA
jgi:hypothetical protein